jgi:alpha-1,2-mannosyltransferase
MVPTSAVVTALRTEHHALDLVRITGLPSGTLYPTLVRLERTGLVRARWHAGRRVYRAGDSAQPEPSERPSWLPAILIATVLAWMTLHRDAAARMPDFQVYLGAVDGLRHGASLYDFARDNAPFTYPPFAGVLFWPLTWPPTLAVQTAWTVATIATVLWLARKTGAKALILMLSAPIASDLRYGQVSLFLAALVALDVLRPSRAQGVLVGVAAAIKLTPLIFIPMLWVTGRRRAAVFAAGTFAVCGAIGAAVLPGDSWRFWTTEMFHVSRLGNITSVGNQSLNGALMRLDAPMRPALALAAGGVVAILALRRAARAASPLEALIVVGAASVVLSPVSWTHHQVWLVLAVLLPIPRLGKVAVAAIMLLPVTALDDPLWSNARLILAMLVAAALPTTQRTRSCASPHRIRWQPAQDREGPALRAHSRTGRGQGRRDREHDRLIVD